MINRRFIQKIILYSYIHNNKYYDNIKLINNLIRLNKLICRQNPLNIVNKQNKIVGTKTILIDNKLNLFLYKLVLFTIPNIQKSGTLINNIFRFDERHNPSFIVRHQTFFFEYRKYKISDIFNNYTFNIKLIFNRNVNNIDKINYIDKIIKNIK